MRVVGCKQRRYRQGPFITVDEDLRVKVSVLVSPDHDRPSCFRLPRCMQGLIGGQTVKAEDDANRNYFHELVLVRGMEQFTRPPSGNFIEHINRIEQ